MVIIGEIITTLRKRNNMSQSDLAKKLNASRDIISKYERGLNTPSLDMAQKIANVFEVTVDFLLGKGTFAKYDKEAIKRLEDIENLDSNTRNILFGVIDTFLRDAKARQAYGG